MRDVVSTSGCSVRAPVCWFWTVGWRSSRLMKSPTVIRPSRIARPPKRIMITPITPMMTVENAVMEDTPVIDCAMLR